MLVTTRGITAKISESLKFQLMIDQPVSSRGKYDAPHLAIDVSSQIRRLPRPI
jgi:hypothetical protein